MSKLPVILRRILPSSVTLWGIVLILTLAALPAVAQEYRATVLGAITDPTGAAVPDANIVLSNVETGIKTTAKTNGQGLYSMFYVLPGNYALTVEVTGFKTYVRNAIELKTSDRLQLDVALQLGSVNESIVVTSESPMLETASADRGHVVDNESLNNLPIPSGNPYTLVNLSAGVQYTGSMLYYRPFDNGAINSFTINGGQNATNEFQMDGVPNTIAGSGNVAYVPPAEATQEFKVQTNTYDAQYGRTGGGIINVSSKSGTNDLHGAVYWNFRRDPLYANTYVRNQKGLPRLSPQSVDQYGFEVGGPVVLPKVYDGRNRTFFMFAMERYKDISPLFGAGTTTVATKDQRNGDFSTTYNSAGNVTPIYDPSSTTLNPNYNPNQPLSVNNAQYIRTAFPGNKIPTFRMNPVAVAMLAAFPLPNQPGDLNTQTNNFLGVNQIELNKFYNLIARVDDNINARWKMYVSWDRNVRRVYNPAGQNGWNTPASTGDFWAARINDGAGVDAVGVLSASTTVDFHLGFTRYNGFALYTSQFDQTTLGLPSALLAAIPLPKRFPSVNFDNYTNSANPNDNSNNPSNTYSLSGTVNKIAGKHSMKFGSEYRLLQTGYVPASSDEAGSYTFTRTETQAFPQVNDNGNSGNAIASMLLGDMDSAFVNIKNSPMYSWHVPAVYFQDNWQVNHRLSLNLGLRWDFESPVVERNNEQLRGFDFSAASPVIVPGYVLRGGPLYAGVGVNPRGAFNPDWSNIGPRIGFSYRPIENHPLVMRGGFGIYYVPTFNLGQSTGFSATTNSSPLTATYLPASTLSNPYPTGLIAPSGAGLGLATQLGSSISFNDVNRSIPRMQQYSFGFEYELHPGLLLETTYVGSRTQRLQVNQDLSHLSVAQLGLGSSYLNTVVPNPFYGVLPASSTLGSQKTIQQRKLLTPYPQYSSVTMNTVPVGSSWYNSLQLSLEQRFRYGLSFLVSYTKSKTMTATQYLNPQDSRLSRQLSSNDVPQRLVISGAYSFPWGQGRKWLSQGALGKVVGNWQLGWDATIQRGTPLGWSSGYVLTGNPALPSGKQTIQRWFDTSPSLWVPQTPDTLRTLPFNSPNIRNYMKPQLDANLQREFHIRENHRLDARISAFNATNTPILGGVNTNPSSSQFGVVSTTTNNLPREVEFDLKYRF